MIKKEGWENKTIDDCFESIRNGACIKQNDSHGGIPITRIETISNSTFNRDRLGYANIVDSSLYSKFILNEGDILMSHINSLKYLGRAVLYKKHDDEKIIHGMNLLNLISKKNIIKPQYITYYFCSEIFKNQITRIAKKSVNQASFTTTDLKKIKVSIPPLSTQQQIVSELDALSDIITKKKQQLEELDKLAQATFYDMFGDPVSNKKGWEMKKLKQMCTKLNDGTHFSPISTKEGDFKYITAKNIKKSGFDFSNLTYISEKDHREIFSRFNPEYGDILYIKDGATTGIAQINTLKEEFSLLSSVALLKYDRALVHGYYLRDMLNNESVYRFIRSNMGGVAITRLTIQKINMFTLPIPPLSLQENYCDKISVLEKQKKLINKSIGDVQLLFDYTMDKYFN